MAEERKPRTLATKAAASIPKFVRGNLAATLKAKEEGKKVADAYINDGQDEIIRAMDIVPAWGESFAGVCAAKREAEQYLRKAEADNFSRSLCTYATCTIGFDMWREELGGEMPPKAPWCGMGRPDMIPGNKTLPEGRACFCGKHVLSSLGRKHRPSRAGKDLCKVRYG